MRTYLSAKKGHLISEGLFLSLAAPAFTERLSGKF